MRQVVQETRRPFVICVVADLASAGSDSARAGPIKRGR